MGKLKLTDIRKPLKIQPQQECWLFRIGRYQNYVLDFDVLLSDGTPLQRPYYWSQLQKSELIKSVLKEIKIPPIYVICGGDGDKTYRIVDGKQRLSTLIDFYNGEFPVTIDGVDYFYSDLDKDAQNEIKYFYITARIAYEPLEKINGKNEAIKFEDSDLIEWFELINFSGTPQDNQHLQILKSKFK